MLMTEDEAKKAIRDAIIKRYDVTLTINGELYGVE